MAGDRKRLEEARGFFADTLARVSGQYRPEIDLAFRRVRREVFLPPGPWLTFTESGYVPTPSADPMWLQRDLLFAIDPAKGINNGQPSLHGSWLAAVSPKPGERVLHVGCGNGFYSAILASLVGPLGTVAAFEIEPEIAAAARRNLALYPQIALHAESATIGTLPASDIIYVNASSHEPLPIWLDALRPGGRLVFPWQADLLLSVSVLIAKTANGFSAGVLGPSRFIPLKMPTRWPSAHRGRDAIWQMASLVRSADRQPDETTVAVFDGHWFSTAPVD